MRYKKWIIALAAFLLPGIALNLNAFWWGIYSVLALAMLGRYRDMQARIAAGETDAALFTQEEMLAAYERAPSDTYDATDRTFYPAGSRELQWVAYDEEMDFHPDECKSRYY